MRVKIGRKQLRNNEMYFDFRLHVGTSVSSSTEGHRTHVSAHSDMSPRAMQRKIINELESTVYALDRRKLVQTHVRKMCVQAPPQAEQDLGKLSRITHTHTISICF